jgi:organic radical activating enzyme
MSVDQIKKFIEQAKSGGGISKLKLLGGEPLMHPQFVEIYDLLNAAIKDGIIKFIKVETNKTIAMPKVEPSSFISWKGRVQKKKKHQPALWSPKDMGIPTTIGQCQQLSKCGFSIDKYGYLPCSPAIMIARLLKLTHLYKKDFPTKPWGLEELCPHSVFSTSAEWRSKYSCKSIFDFTEEERSPTKSFKEGLENFKSEEFYNTHSEF